MWYHLHPIVIDHELIILLLLCMITMITMYDYHELIIQLLPCISEDTVFLLLMKQFPSIKFLENHKKSVSSFRTSDFVKSRQSQFILNTSN